MAMLKFSLLFLATGAQVLIVLFPPRARTRLVVPRYLPRLVPPRSPVEPLPPLAASLTPLILIAARHRPLG